MISTEPWSDEEVETTISPPPPPPPPPPHRSDARPTLPPGLVYTGGTRRDPSTGKLYYCTARQTPLPTREPSVREDEFEMNRAHPRLAQLQPSTPIHVPRGDSEPQRTQPVLATNFEMAQDGRARAASHAVESMFLVGDRTQRQQTPEKPVDLSGLRYVPPIPTVDNSEKMPDPIIGTHETTTPQPLHERLHVQLGKEDRSRVADVELNALQGTPEGTPGEQDPRTQHRSLGTAREDSRVGVGLTHTVVVRNEKDARPKGPTEIASAQDASLQPSHPAQFVQAPLVRQSSTTMSLPVDGTSLRATPVGEVMVTGAAAVPAAAAAAAVKGEVVRRTVRLGPTASIPDASAGYGVNVSSRGPDSTRPQAVQERVVEQRPATLLQNTDHAPPHKTMNHHIPQTMRYLYEPQAAVRPSVLAGSSMNGNSVRLRLPDRHADDAPRQGAVRHHRTRQSWRIPTITRTLPSRAGLVEMESSAGAGKVQHVVSKTPARAAQVERVEAGVDAGAPRPAVTLTHPKQDTRLEAVPPWEMQAPTPVGDGQRDSTHPEHSRRETVAPRGTQSTVATVARTRDTVRPEHTRLEAISAWETNSTGVATVPRAEDGDGERICQHKTVAPREVIESTSAALQHTISERTHQHTSSAMVVIPTRESVHAQQQQQHSESGKWSARNRASHSHGCFAPFMPPRL